MVNHDATIPPALSNIVSKCLERDLQLRYQNAGEILEPGTTRHFAAQDSIILSTGNAGGLLLKINDIPAKELGQKGEVRQFRITPSNLKDFIG